MLTQAGRHIRINTPLGEDAVFLESFEGEEHVSKHFSFTLGLLTADPGFDMAGLLNQPVVVSLILSDDSDRHFHGLINEIEEVETRADDLVFYRATMVPWLWFLTLFEDCRIFQNLTAVEIVLQVFQDRGFSDFTNSTTGTYQQREYCVQYRETDLNFISRVLEEEGICYFFQHDEDKHTLVLADQASSFVDCPGQASAAFDTVPGLWHEEDVVLSIRRAKLVKTGKVTVNDYDFEKPNTTIDANLDGARKGEIYEYPARYKVRDDGCKIARVRLEAQEVQLEVVTGTTNCRAFRAGYRFSLTGHFRAEANQTYTLLSIYHQAASNPFISQDEQSSFDYSNRLEAMLNSAPYRPPRLARRPVIQGSQTAVVVGKAGEEIWTDQYGRVIVQFFWDRAGKKDEKSSCWVRVAQLWAGKGWGAIFTPRIGQEVIVDFLEGDPDRPIITGRVYNADQTPPYDLPTEQTKSTIKSMSSKGGGGFNEIRLEDKKDSEQVFIFGQKDQDIRIQNDVKEWVGNDRHLIVTRDRMDQVGRDDHGDIARDHIESVGRDHHLQVTGKEAIKITGSHSFTVVGDVIEVFQGSQSTQVSKDVYIKATNIVLEASTALTLKVGSNFITIDASGIAITGMPAVNINSGGAALSGNAGSAVPPLSPTNPTPASTADPGQQSTPTPNPGEVAKTSASNIRPFTGSLNPVTPPTQSPASDAPSHNPNAPENQKKKSWIEITLVGEDGIPIPGEAYKIALPDGSTVADGTLDDKGWARVDNIDPGTCKVTFPNLDKDSWEPK